MLVYYPKPKRIALTSGYIFVLGPEPTELSEPLAQLAIEHGALPYEAGKAPAAPPAEPQKIETHMTVEEAVRIVVEDGAKDDFNLTGVPKLRVIKKIVGDDSITASDVEAAFNKLSEVNTDGGNESD